MKLQFYFLLFTMLFFSVTIYGQKITKNGEGYTPVLNQTKSKGSLPFFDGFEDGDYSEYTDLGGTTVTEVISNTQANGTYSLHIDGGSFDTGLRMPFSDGKPYYISLYVMSPQSGGGAACYFDLYNSGNERTIFFFIDTEAGKGPNVYSSGNIYYGSYTSSKWYFIEFKNIDYNNNTFDFYVEGSLVKENISFTNSSDFVNSFELHNYSNGEGYWDDINIDTDETAPVPDVEPLPDTTSQCEVTSLNAPTATDNIAGTITGTHDATLPIKSTTTVTWTYDDGYGNTTTQTQNVVIDDATAPVPDNDPLADVTAECEVTSLTAPTATDNCAGIVTGTHDATLPITTQGTTTVTWTYSDGNGNTSTQTQDVVINDVTAPVPDTDPLSDVTAECEVTSLTAPTATDNCAGTVTGTHDATLPITTQGTTTVTWTYDDGNGNTSTQTQDVVIDDVTAPVPDTDPLSDVTAECEVTSLTAPTATDNCTGNVTGTHNATLPITAQGTTTVTWTYNDGNGNTTTQTQNVVIDDATAPVPDNDPLADITAECEVTSLTAPTATDNCAGTVTGTHEATLPITAQGTTTVTWTYSDGNGNASTQTQNVVIDDATAPLPDNDPLADVTAECEVTSLAAPTATDNCTGTVTGTHDAALPITTQGTTTVTWTYSDGNGNTSTQTQDVVIDDLTAPTLSVQDISVDLDESGSTSISAADVVTNASDNCILSDTTLSQYEFTTDDVGDVNIDVTVKDATGNSTTKTAVITVNETTTGINDIQSIDADIYPNPSTGVFYLEFNEKIPGQVKIMSLTGKSIIHKTNLEERNTINLSELPDGIYLLRIYLEESIVNKKIIKE